MALGFSTGARNTMLDNLRIEIDTHASPAQLQIYGTTRPAMGAAAGGSALATFTLSDPCAPAASNGVLALTAPAQVAASNSGTAQWFRIAKGDGTTAVIDGSIGTSGADLNLVTTSITVSQPVQITSFTLTLTSQA